jgi:Gamma tubulin complex component C-terminal
LIVVVQVDVVDSEFCILLEETSNACDFQTVLRAHRSFIATVMRLSSVDNLLVQEGIERVLQVCLRFIAVCRLLHQQEGEASAPNTPRGLRHMGIPRTDDKDKRAAPVVIPSEEIEGVRREFFTQISYLFQIMRKVENRGLMFRLDFNGYLSALAEEMGSGLER